MAIPIKIGLILGVLLLLLLLDISLAGTSGYVDLGDTKGKFFIFRSFDHRSSHLSEIYQVQKKSAFQFLASKILLETKDYNVTETSYAVGFNNPLYFSRLFTKHVSGNAILPAFIICFSQ